jgi:hypothetical protein
MGRNSSHPELKPDVNNQRRNLLILDILRKTRWK